MRVELCNFSGFKIHPGHGKMLVQTDSKTTRFLSNKCQSPHMVKKSPQKEDWTIFARRHNKKGFVEETEQKTIKKVTKAPRGIAGMSVEAIEQKKREVAEKKKKMNK